MIPSLTHASLASGAASHGFFTRAGGVSLGPYASLNASLSGGDDPALVARNRARVAASLGVEAASLLGVTQVHGTGVVSVTTAWPAGTGARADAMVTATPGLALGVITADCAPVLFLDQAARVAGAAHAGWRGAAAGVLEATLAAMQHLGAQPGRTVAVVGPCIAQASYEVGQDLYEAVVPSFTGAARHLVAGRPGHWHFDLAGYCVARLRAAGATAAALHIDTCQDEARFFSHRRRTLAGGGKIGHQISAIVIK